MSDLWLLPAAAFATAVLAPGIHSILPRASRWILAALPAFLFGWLATRIPLVATGEVATYSRSWVESLGLTFSLRLDGLALLLCLLIVGIGSLVVAYSGGYLAGDRRLGEFYADLLAFMSAMLGLVLADNLLLVFVFWELTSVTSYLLISFDRHREAARVSARKALLVTVSGGLALLGGFLLVGESAGTYAVPELLAEFPAQGDPLLHVGVLLILLGALTKSAQMPFHFWLPRAMEAPAPVSAYLHSATMVAAGVYLLARLHPALATSPLWSPVLIASGGASLVFGAILAYRSTHLKKQLAYSTVAALGIMVLLLGVGSRLAVKGAIIFLLVHALYKSALFLTVGTFARATGVTDGDELRGRARAMPAAALAGALAGLSMAGIPPAVGFLAKEVFFEGLWEAGPLGIPMAVVGVIPVACLVFVALVVGLQPYLPSASSADRKAVGRAPDPGMILGPMLLAVAGLVLGAFPGLWGPVLIEPPVGDAMGGATSLDFSLWHGVTPPFLLDASAVGLGALAFAGRARIREMWPAGEALVGLRPDVLFDRSLGALQRVAKRQTRGLWGGSLGDHIAVVAVALLLPTTLVLATAPAGAYASTGPTAGVFDWILTGLILSGVAGTVLLHSTVGAIASLGLTGFGVTLIFVRFGAPDLALTQVLVETLTLILLVLAFLGLSDDRRRPRKGTIRRMLGTLLPVGVGTVMALYAVVASGSPAGSRVSSYIVEEGVARGRGRNLVNVILTDVRSLDTLGEITVVAVAALGIYALVVGGTES